MITKEIIVLNTDTEYNFEYGASKGEALTDYAELWIKHQGIERLDRNVHNDNECILVYAHFLAGTNTLHALHFNVHDMEVGEDDEIIVDLSAEELSIITQTAFEYIEKGRDNM